jgi:small subunit ribosomal protein S16
VATKIRLQRIGAKKKAFYRVVVADSAKAPTGSVVDHVGTYNPHADPPEAKIDFQKVDKWIAKGVRPTEKTAAILNRARKADASEKE